MTPMQYTLLKAVEVMNRALGDRAARLEVIVRGYSARYMFLLDTCLHFSTKIF